MDIKLFDEIRFDRVNRKKAKNENIKNIKYNLPNPKLYNLAIALTIIIRICQLHEFVKRKHETFIQVETAFELF